MSDAADALDRLSTALRQLARAALEVERAANDAALLCDSRPPEEVTRVDGLRGRSSR